MPASREGSNVPSVLSHPWLDPTEVLVSDAFLHLAVPSGRHMRARKSIGRKFDERRDELRMTLAKNSVCRARNWRNWRNWRNALARNICNRNDNDAHCAP